MTASTTARVTAHRSGSARARFPVIGWVGLGMVGFVLLVAVASPWIAPYPPESPSAAGMESPSWSLSCR